MLVLIVVPDIANPFFSDVLRGIVEGLSQHGYGFLIGNLGNSRAKEPQLANVALAGQVDGLLLLNGRIPRGRRQALSPRDIPMVAVCEAIPEAPIPQVEVQNRDAARAAVAHLAVLGYRRIAYLAGPPDNVLEHERRGGFKEGLADAGIPECDALFYPGDFTFRAGIAAADLFLSIRHRPTALFSANDEMAIGFVKRVRTAGLAVPDDVSVIGFDGIDFAEFVEPTLTTFRQPRRELGYRGASLLVSAMRGETINQTSARQRLSMPLLERGSTGPAPQSPPSLARLARSSSARP
jgi:LacI family repressor for deo operon, udp, cdd, tsx, nupC, and nupG